MPCKLLARKISQHRWIHGTITWSPWLYTVYDKQTSKIWLQILGSCKPAWLCHSIYLYAGKDKNYDSSLGLGGSVAVTLAEKLASQVGSNYNITMDNFFTSPNLLRILKAKGIAATGTGIVRINRVENAPFRPIK